MSLYELSSECQQLLAMWESAENDDDRIAISDKLATLSTDLSAKADAYCALIKVAETRADARGHEVERMRKLEKSDNALASQLRHALLTAMTLTNTDRLNTDRFRVSVARNGGKLPLLIERGVEIPALYMVTETTEIADKDLIRDALERGVEIAGCRLGERGTRLDIR